MALERVLQLEEDSRLKLRRDSAPAQQPVTRTEVAQHLNLDADQEQADGPLLDRLIKAATSWCEEYLSRQLITATWSNTYNIFHEPLQVWYPPVQMIDLFTYVNDQGQIKEIDRQQYVPDIFVEPAEISLAAGETWPSSLQDEVNVIRIAAKCGYGDTPDDIPEDIRVAILMKVAGMYENRTAGKETEVSAAENLLKPYRVRLF
jgi:uncharacterized phiE125 gp8 family phage protein